MRIQERLFILLALLILSVSAHASPWFPIDTGRTWVYSRGSGGLETAIIGAPESFAGALVQPLEWDNGDVEYFSEDGSGRVFENGVGGLDGHYVVFDPPFLRMDSELTVGHGWETITQVIFYNADDVELIRYQERYSYQVIGVGQVEVGAGIFEAFELLTTQERGPFDAPFSQQKKSSAREYVAEGIGWILRTDETGGSTIFELEAYGLGGVSNDTSSWGALKAQYED